MKATSLRLLQGFLIAGCAAAENAYLYTLDIKPRQLSSSISSSIDSETANAILTRRLGGTESTRLGPVDNLRLEHLNNYGGQQTLQLFGDETSASASDRLIIAIEGYDGKWQDVPRVFARFATADMASSRGAFNESTWHHG